MAKVRNSGDLLCKGVVVDFFAIEFTTGDGPMVPLGSDTHDIAPNAVQEFTAGWTPPSATGHYCIVVRIRLYQDPTVAGVFETNIYNNEARTNYTRFVSASASPSTRAVAQVRLANPFDESTMVHAVVHQTHPYHRVYLDHRWLRVPGGSSLPVQVFDEALAGFPDTPGTVTEELWGRDNHVSIEGWADLPQPADCGAPTLTGGAGIRVGAGRATVTRLTEASLSFAEGTVDYVDDQGGAPEGTVLVVVQESDATGVIDPIGDRVTAQGTVHNGVFGFEYERRLAAEHGVVQAHFLGAAGAAPSESAPRRADD
ncbi:hypothetical protein G3I20_17825 [Streptomyces sp. SID8111]|uniref:hypothetical protein n=1 Tax=Streptomyces sp. SID8111 TaxID=2706100 RepID=UPI0013BEE406|nr:hypothetical protein [Streptomyces sp. SID8111]NEC28377.1 hypothetical protein [Streptomyces sp. SID8111]